MEPVLLILKMLAHLIRCQMREVLADLADNLCPHLLWQNLMQVSQQPGRDNQHQFVEGIFLQFAKQKIRNGLSRILLFRPPGRSPRLDGMTT